MGGLTFREGAFVCEFVAETHRLVSMDLTEVNPKLGDEQQVARTVDMGRRMINCALGETLLWGTEQHYRKFLHSPI